jgi:hypothetical protein
VRFKVLATLITKITVFWDVRPCLVHSINIFDEPTVTIFNVHRFYPEESRYMISCTLKTETAGSCKTSVLIHNSNFQVYLKNTHCTGYNQLKKHTTAGHHKRFTVAFPFRSGKYLNSLLKLAMPVSSSSVISPSLMLHNLWETDRKTESWRDKESKNAPQIFI